VASRTKIFRIILPLTLLVFLSAGSLYYWRAPSVLFTSEGKTRRIFSKAKTIRDLLAEQHLKLGPDDFTTPPVSTPLSKNLAIKLTRVTIRFSTVTTQDPAVITWQNRTRENLRLALAQRGTRIEYIQKIRTVFYDGTEVKHRVVAQKKKRHPFLTLTLFDKKGFPAKKYDLLKAKTFHMLATGYYVGDPMVPGDETRLGYKLQRGLVAVDPKVIPLGSRLYIPGYGYAFAADTGSAIKGLRIDLAVKDAKEEKRYNHRKVTIYVLGKTNKW
jgi:3D (Asp-Asp-Asp) domain-containing protein